MFGGSRVQVSRMKLEQNNSNQPEYHLHSKKYLLFSKVCELTVLELLRITKFVRKFVPVPGTVYFELTLTRNSQVSPRLRSRTKKKKRGISLRRLNNSPNKQMNWTDFFRYKDNFISFLKTYNSDVILIFMSIKLNTEDVCGLYF